MWFCVVARESLSGSGTDCVYDISHVCFEPICMPVRPQADAPSSLSELLAKVDPSGRRSIVRNMSIQLIPIMEKGILDPVLSHRRASQQHAILQLVKTNMCSVLPTCLWNQNLCNLRFRRRLMPCCY